jgi:hypothetical protein
MGVLNASTRLVLLGLALLLLAASYAALSVSAEEPQQSQQSEPPEVQPPIVDAERVAELEKMLSNATLVGHFTVTGEDEGDGDESKLTKERYELGEVKHLGSNQWLIQSRIKYGDHDVTVPLTLPIRWAGDTPMICLDELPIPGLGTFTARVMIYRDHYAGFWSGKDHGGHLFGVIERGKQKGEDDKPTNEQPTPPAN